MSSNQPSAAVAKAIAANQSQQPSDDKLDKIRAEARAARDLEFAITSLQQQIKENKEKLNHIYMTTLPEMLDDAGLSAIRLNKEGNYPAYDFKVKPYYSANIAASWPNEKREAGFEFVKRLKAEDLIKTEVVVLFPKGGFKIAQKLLKQAKKLKVPVLVGKKKTLKPVQVELSKSIPHASLSAWLKELVEKHHTVLSASDLEKIGGSIGRIVKPEEVKE